MSVAFVAIGDELLRGNTHEANGYHLAQVLEQQGVALREARHVSDARAAILGAVAELRDRCPLLLVTGGLGPTDDDQTRAAMAQAAGVSLRRDADVLAQLEARYAARGRRFGPANATQADFPVGARVLANDFGSAPGFALPMGDTWVACFPGVPREWQGMLSQHLQGLLELAGVPTRPRAERLLRVFGIAESAMQERIAALPGYGHVVVRSLPGFPEIRLHVAAAADAPAGALDAWTEAVRADLGWRVFRESPEGSVGHVVRDALARRGATVAVAESCTGGLVGDLLTDAPGMSAHLLAGVVSYSNAAKEALLGVDPALLAAHGAVSEPVARAMAEGIRARTGADFAVATSGIAGPAGGSVDKPVGTICIAVAHAGGTRSWRHVFAGLDRRRFKILVAWSALFRLRAAVLAD